MKPFGSMLWRHFRVYQVFGANTNVGKTIFSTILLRKLRDSGNAWYLKPVSTGAVDDADTRHLDRYAKGAVTQSIYQFDSPISPHLAALETKSPTSSEWPSDSLILEKVFYQVQANALSGPGFMLVETAGGPNSPGPSGTLQSDLYRPLRLPIIFVADWQLGGISTSISAFESLRIRGYDIEGVTVLKDSYYRNFEYFKSYFRQHDIPVLAVSQPPAMTAEDDVSAMTEYYRGVDKEAQSGLSQFTDQINRRHDSRISRLESAATNAVQRIWWPFTQHQKLRPESITTIDSATGDYFQTLVTKDAADGVKSKQEDPAANILQPTVDASASWWTQGLGHANHDLTMAAAHAAGRYGHVMFAGAINEPALSLATNLLGIVANHRLKRVFYSDNGSTGMEVGLKMALKATCVRYGWNIAQKDIEVIGLKGSYHGDTIGAMDMSEPSVFNDRIHWYKGRGFWFECPSVKMVKGRWIVDKPVELQELGTTTKFDSLQHIFDPSRDLTDDAALYEKYIRSTLERLTREEKRYFGALVLEPVVLGAGGMILVDPLFQRTLVNVVRRSTELFSLKSSAASQDPRTTDWSGLPVLADEVFTGLYRLGHATSSSLLHVVPDIATYAKLLTGGLVPLSCTLSSEEIYEAFLADGKADALLHGHSYTAHPVGCEVANTSLRLLSKLDADGKWDSFKEDWTSSHRAGFSVATSVKEKVASVLGNPSTESGASLPHIWSVWSTDFLTKLSNSTDRVEGVWALGSILSISLRDEDGAGYASDAAKSLQRQLLADTGSGWNIHSRVLGNVLYFMTSQTSEIAHVRAWEQRVKAALGIE